MTPSAMSRAAREAAAKRAPAGRAPKRAQLPKQPAPRIPRRLSGPLRGADSDLVRVRSRPRASTGSSLTARALASLRNLPDHALLDRIVRGRAWIPLLGIMLAGIVAMQVEVLKLEAGIGRSMQRSSELAARNDLLRADVARLADDQRIESLAARMGMAMPAPGAITFLPAHRDGDAGHAIANIHSPDPGTFLSTLGAQTGDSSSGSTQTDGGSTGSTPTDAGSGGSAQTSSGPSGSPRSDGGSGSSAQTDGGPTGSTQSTSAPGGPTQASSASSESTQTTSATGESTQTTTLTGG